MNNPRPHSGILVVVAGSGTGITQPLFPKMEQS